MWLFLVRLKWFMQIWNVTWSGKIHESANKCIVFVENSCSLAVFENTIDKFFFSLSVFWPCAMTEFCREYTNTAWRISFEKVRCVVEDLYLFCPVRLLVCNFIISMLGNQTCVMCLSILRYSRNWAGQEWGGGDLYKIFTSGVRISQVWTSSLGKE